LHANQQQKTINVSTFSALSNLGNKIRASSGEDKETIPAHLCSYSTFKFCAFARLFHQGRSRPI